MRHIILNWHQGNIGLDLMKQAVLMLQDMVFLHIIDSFVKPR